MRVFGALLAAGTSLRMGQNKLLMSYGGSTIMEKSLNHLMKSRVDQIVVITGHEQSLIEKQIKNRLSQRVRIEHNSDYRQGRASSIKTAVSSVRDKADALLFMVADKPTVSAELIDRAIDEFRSKSPEILYVQAPGGRGHPIIFAGGLFDELMLLEGDLAGQEMVERHRRQVIELPDEDNQLDIDTPDEYRMAVQALYDEPQIYGYL